MAKARVAVVVCPVVPFPPQTGAQKRTLRLLEAIEAAGVTPHVLSADPLASPEQIAGIEQRGWPIDVVPERPPTRAARLRQHVARLPSPYLEMLATRLRELLRERPAWVQLEHGWTSYYLRELIGVRSLWSLHNLDSRMIRTSAAAMPAGGARARTEVRWRAMQTTERWAAHRASLVLCVTENERSALEELGARTMLIPNGVDRELLDVPDSQPPGEEVLFFGQLRYEPNRRGLLRFLADGWPAVTRARPRASLRVVGEGADDGLRRAVEAAPAAELVGLVPEIGPELARAAVVVVPIWEGAGTRLKALEAMAAARPVVGTSLGVSGIGFVEPRHGLVADDPAGLGRATAELLADPERRAAIGPAARELATAFAWDKVLAPLADLYRDWAAASEREHESRLHTQSR